MSMTERLRLDPAGLEQMRETFLARMDDFGDFGDVPSRYHAEERAYKDEMARLFNVSLPPSLFDARTGPEDPEHDRVVTAATLRVLTARLESVGIPQNVIGWRYVDFLRQLEPPEAATFAPALGELLYGPGESPERVDAFVRALWPVWQRTLGGNPYAVSRIFPTCFLMLRDPRSDLAVRTDMVTRAVKLLRRPGEWLLEYKPFNAPNYRRVLEFAGAIRGALQSWGWYPRDMIDVHSFMWVGTRTPEELGGDADEQET